MKLSDKWFTALSENEKGDLITIYGREELEEFVTSGKFKERIEVTWKYTPDAKGLPSDNEAELMENVEIAFRTKIKHSHKNINNSNPAEEVFFFLFVNRPLFHLVHVFILFPFRVNFHI